MLDNQNIMHEMMIDVFLDLQEDDFDSKNAKEILLTWVQWIDARYKVAVIPNICYAIVDCESGDLVSMINIDIPDAKKQANDMCASLNHVEQKDETSNNDVDLQDVADAFLNMNEDEFMSFLLDNMSEEKEE